MEFVVLQFVTDKYVTLAVNLTIVKKIIFRVPVILQCVIITAFDDEKEF